MGSSLDDRSSYVAFEGYSGIRRRKHLPHSEWSVLSSETFVPIAWISGSIPLNKIPRNFGLAHTVFHLCMHEDLSHFSRVCMRRLDVKERSIL